MQLRSGLALLSLTLILAGCGGPGKDAPVGEGTHSGDSGVSAPTGADKPTGKLEVAAFKGGYGIDFYQAAAKEFDEKNPGLTTTVTGGPRIWEQLKPLMVAGTPPDLMFPGWGMDQWALVADEQLMVLDKALDSPAYDGKGSWRETFNENVLKLCQKDGRTYMLPLYVIQMGWWYDPAVFKKNGWTPPKTYAELLDLSEKIKAKGIAPITYQGQYPYYMLEGMLLPWAYSVGGAQAVKNAENLEPGAWKSEAMLKAASMINELNLRGDFQNGATGMSHTESQTQFLNGKAAMIPCGTWLHSEMLKSMPKGAQMEFFLPPVVEGGKGEPSALLINIEPWMVPVDAKNANAAVAFFKYMTSLPKAKQFVEQEGTLMAIKGSEEVKLPDILVHPAAAMKSAKEVWANQFRTWYPEMEKEIEGALTSMLNKELTPQQFVDRCEAAAEKTRKDSTIVKYKL